jgi:hypothetical protein
MIEIIVLIAVCGGIVAVARQRVVVQPREESA